jgi:hypothetical protein
MPQADVSLHMIRSGQHFSARSLTRSISPEELRSMAIW